MRVTTALWLLLMAALTGGCERRALSPVSPRLEGEPIIRVRLARGLERITVTSDSAITLHAAEAAPRVFGRSVTLVLGHDQWSVNGAAEADLADSPLLLSAGPRSVLRIDGRAYPDQLRLVPLAGAEDAALRFDLVNHVHLEAYLPGVLDRELYDDWRLTTYHAQAIAARSYALAQWLTVSPGLWYDVEATQASQAYLGHSSSERARQAVLDTTGLVLTHDHRVLMAYYSSTCGGAGLSPLEAWGTPEAPPLSPTPHRAWCEQSPWFAHKTIHRSREDVRRRLSAYGSRHKLPIASLGTITTMSVAERNEAGRPTRFAVTDDQARRYLLRADAFRVACNYADPAKGLDRLPRSHRLPSSFVEPLVKAQQVQFTHIRGFGHGVGLCQYGAEAMAQAGHDAIEILQTYYPGAKIERAY